MSFIVPLSSPEALEASRFGPKAANLARLAHAGLPTPGGFCIDASAYRHQLKALALESAAEAVNSPNGAEARRGALAVKLGFFDRAIDETLREPLLDAWRRHSVHAAAGMAVRSSALVEDRFGSSFAGQFESYLGLQTEEEFETAVRSCWAALWSTRVIRYMATHDASPSETAMAILVQPLVNADASGGALSTTASGDRVINATRGLGASIAQGEVIPERIVLARDGTLREKSSGGSYQRLGCAHMAARGKSIFQASRCLDDVQARELGALVARVEDLMQMPVEIEWALEVRGCEAPAGSNNFKLLQARPLLVESAPVRDALWLKHPGLSGQPAGVGWGEGRGVVVSCECEMERVMTGDVLITRAAGPALSAILPRVSAVVCELGGSTSHLASLARERGIPMVLGVPEATRKIPDGAQVAVDGVAGIVRWAR